VKVLDLFSGIGGFSLGLERAGMETIAFCEQDKFCQKVLAKHWPNVPIFDDVRLLDAKQFRGTVDVVCGGFPCQPFSVAGKQKGKSDERHLWPEMLRIIRECQPAWVIGENVSGFVNMALDDCWADLEAEGYEVQPFIIPACGVEAHHRRDRVWIVAYACHSGRNNGRDNIAGRHIQKHQGTAEENKPEWNGWQLGISKTGGADKPEHGEVVAYSKGTGTRENDSGLWQGAEGIDGRQDATIGHSKHNGPLAARFTKSRLGRELDGLPDWLDGFEYIGNPDRFGTPRITTRKDDRANRLKALGNSVVPQIPEIIGRAIMHITTHPS